MRHIDRRDYAALTGGAQPPVLCTEDADGNLVETPLPMKYDVCGLCEGRGKHVNPSIDGNGLTAEDFEEDPDFAEEYFAGTYDVTCACCRGKRVVAVVDEERMTPETLTAWKAQEAEHAAEARERAAELRLGY